MIHDGAMFACISHSSPFHQLLGLSFMCLLYSALCIIQFLLALWTIATDRGGWLIGSNVHDIIHYIRLGVLAIFAIEWLLVFTVYWHQLFTHVHLLVSKPFAFQSHVKLTHVRLYCVHRWTLVWLLPVFYSSFCWIQSKRYA